MLQLTDGQEIDLDNGGYSWSEIHKIKLERQRNGGITVEQVRSITGRAVSTVGTAAGVVAVGSATIAVGATVAVGKAAAFTLKEASGWNDVHRPGESVWRTLSREILGA